MASKATKSLNILPVADLPTRANFDQITKAFEEECPICVGHITDKLSLVSGDNLVIPPVPRPLGRVTVFLDAAVTIIDVGMVGKYWKLTTSGACTARFIFF